jgi:hypothetical protein
MSLRDIGMLKLGNGEERGDTFHFKLGGGKKILQ